MRIGKPLAAAFSLAVLLAILWPIRQNWQPKPKDDFPLSYFPMFSHKRGATYKVNYFIGYDDQGQRYCVPYRFAGSGGFNQVRRQINKKVKRGKGASVLDKVAERLARSEQEPYLRLTRVALVTGEYHLDDYFLKNHKMPLYEEVLAEKTIERP